MNHALSLHTKGLKAGHMHTLQVGTEGDSGVARGPWRPHQDLDAMPIPMWW